jgi:hypothetical protein
MQIPLQILHRNKSVEVVSMALNKTFEFFIIGQKDNPALYLNLIDYS